MKALLVRRKCWEEEKQRMSDDELNRYLKRNLRKQVGEQVREYSVQLTAMFLWTLHQKYGWGKKKLLDFGKCMQPQFDDLVKTFEMEQDDLVWLCERFLDQNCGITHKDLENLFIVESEVTLPDGRTARLEA